MTVETAYGYLFRTVLCVLIAYALCGIVRAIMTKELCGRVMSVNMTGSAVTAAIMIVAAMLNEGFLIDVAIVYVLVNFISVVILNRVLIGGKGKDGGES